MTRVMLSMVALAVTFGAMPAAQAQSPSAARLKSEAFAIVDSNAGKMGRISDAIFSYSEIGFQEFKTVALLKKTLEAAGYTVETGVADIPTAYVAKYGSGSPVLGLMADFDGVPGTSQKPTSLVYDPIVPGAPGHGEGHNTHQPVLVGAALAIKDLKDKYNLPGTIIVYGGPAEELLASRGYMVNAGLFKGVDAMLDIHISSDFGTFYGMWSNALISAQWSFKGRPAHGAMAWQGRSALDAVELTDMAVNFMREHIDPAARVHNVISAGGQQPNVVPADATVWYYFRHNSAENVWDLFTRARRAAQGAALATDTVVSERILSATWPVNGNKELAEIVHKNISLVGMPKWSADDQAFARALQKSMGSPIVGLPTKIKPLERAVQGFGSSDVGDVTWQVPYARMTFPAVPSGSLAIHHWSAGIGPATPVAHKGIAAASKVLAASMIDLMVTPKAVASIKTGFAQQLAAHPAWRSLIPPDARPPTYLNTAEMAKYREALEKFEYDPESAQTYLEFLGVPYPPAEPQTAVGKASNTAGQ